MIPIERQQQILHLLAERGVVSILELTERLDGSHMTVRRDIQKLEQQGRVLSVGVGRLDTQGKRVPVQVNEGDRVVFSAYAGTEIEIDGDALLIMSEGDILAVLE